MFKINRSVFIDITSVTLLGILLILSVLPGFSRIGKLFEQVALTVFLDIIILLVFDFILKIRPVLVSYSLIIMTVFWLVFAIIKQVFLHISLNDYSFGWLHLFYYDKPALIFVAIFTSILYYVMKLFNKRNSSFFVDSYRKFIKNSVVCSLGYYAVILFYCFYLVRDITFERPVPNLVPFDVIRLSVSNIDYELLFLLLGNIAIFFPLGVFVSSLNSNKVLNILLPVVVSVGIEVSQYYLGNGHPDVDDVILNVIGYYFGFFVRVLLDKIVFKASDAKFKSFILLGK